MFGALIIPAIVGGAVGSTSFGRNIWPQATAGKGALVGAGLGLGYSLLKSNGVSRYPGHRYVSGNIDQQRKFYSRQQGEAQALYTRSISAGGIFDGICLT